MYGGLIRVLQGTYPTRPDNLVDIVQRAERFVIFFPVRAAAWRGIGGVVDHQDDASHARAFPLFKSGRPGNWWLWDGEREWRIGELTPGRRIVRGRGLLDSAVL